MESSLTRVRAQRNVLTVRFSLKLKHLFTLTKKLDYPIAVSTMLVYKAFVNTLDKDILGEAHLHPLYIIKDFTNYS